VLSCNEKKTGVGQSASHVRALKKLVPLNLHGEKKNPKASGTWVVIQQEKNRITFGGGGRRPTLCARTSWKLARV
jgi:hypothetical protein